MKKSSIILRDKIFNLAVITVNPALFRQKDGREYALCGQIPKSKTAFGALTPEAAYAQSNEKDTNL